MAQLGTKADFSQQDPRWSGQMLGFATWQTLGGYGCYVTSYANVAQANGKDVDVAQMNELLKQHNLFSVDSTGQRSDISRNDALSVVFPDIQFVEAKYWGSQLADIAYFDVRNTTKTEIIVYIDYHPDRAGIQSHFCRVIGINDSKTDVEVVDSYTGKRIWLSSLGAPANKLIFSAFKFNGPGSSSSAPAQTPTPQPAPAPAVHRTIYLPPTTGPWHLYNENGPFNPAYAKGLLVPSEFGGLTYQIVADKGNGVIVIDTQMFGRGALWTNGSDVIIK